MLDAKRTDSIMRVLVRKAHSLHHVEDRSGSESAYGQLSVNAIEDKPNRRLFLATYELERLQILNQRSLVAVVQRGFFL